MTTLAQRQAGFIALIHDEDRPLPTDFTARHAAGMEVYRNNYRTSLIDVILDTYPRTAKWVGEESFRQAAAHHLIVKPPSSWTLDDAGEGFDATLTELFAMDLEVSELAWVEWSMHRCFSATDAVPMTSEQFAGLASGFGEDEWLELRVRFMPQLATRLLSHDLPKIWKATDAETSEQFDYHLDRPIACHVYRDGESPVFITGEMGEAEAVRLMSEGATFADICEMIAEEKGPESAAAEAGSMLARLIGHGMIQGIETH